MNDYKWLWIDCEMTGLDLDSDILLEVACYVSDKSLSHISPGPSLVIQCNLERLEAMSEWCQQTHKSTGLWDKCLSSEMTVGDVESDLITFLEEKMPKKSNWILAGNSVYTDLNFIKKAMPDLSKRLHYKTLDVSGIAMAMRAWLGCPAFVKKGTHRAQDDILESIAELQYYQKMVVDNAEK